MDTDLFKYIDFLMKIMSESSINAIEVVDLYRYYDDVKAVDGVSFHIPSGKLYSLLGPNGAGKTTVINMLSCNLQIDNRMISSIEAIIGISLNIAFIGYILASKRFGIKKWKGLI